MDLGDGNTHVVERDAFQVEFLDLPFQRFLAPDVVFVVTVDQSQQGHLRCLELHLRVVNGVAIHEVIGRVVPRFEDGSLSLQGLHRDHARGVGSHRHTDAVVVHDVLRYSVFGLMVSTAIGQDDIGFVALEGLQGRAPVLHDELDGQSQLAHHGFHDIDVRPGRIALVVEELIRRLVPVADHDDRALSVVFLRECLCQSCDRSDGQEGDADDNPFVSH